MSGFFFDFPAVETLLNFGFGCKVVYHENNAIFNPGTVFTKDWDAIANKLLVKREKYWQFRESVHSHIVI